VKAMVVMPKEFEIADFGLQIEQEFRRDAQFGLGGFANLKFEIFNLKFFLC
jgi:hypothetical protein